MGHGIAQVAAAANYPVVLFDVNWEALARGVEAIERNMARGMELAKLTEAERENIRQRIRGTIHLSEAAPADLIIEAVPERLELKQELREIELLAGPRAIFASNTSSLSITEIASVASRPE